jgi:hypothetical protein
MVIGKRSKINFIKSFIRRQNPNLFKNAPCHSSRLQNTTEVSVPLHGEFRHGNEVDQYSQTSGTDTQRLFV